MVNYFAVVTYFAWHRKTTWIRSLTHRASKICSICAVFADELKQTSILLPWNGFPRRLSSKSIEKFTPNHTPTNHTHDDIQIQLPFIGKYCTFLIQRFKMKLSRPQISPCIFIVNWNTNTSGCCLSCKDRTPKQYQSSVYLFRNCHVPAVYSLTSEKQTDASTLEQNNIVAALIQKSTITSTPANNLTT